MNKKYLEKDMYLQKKHRKLLIIEDNIVIQYKNEISKKTYLLDNRTIQPSKSRIENWVEINDELRRTYNADSDIKFKTLMMRSNLCHYSDAYIHIKLTKLTHIKITVPNTATNAALINNSNKKIIFKNCAPFTNSISEINDTQVADV